MPIQVFFFFLAVFIEAGKDLAIEEMADASSWNFNRVLYE